MRYTQAIILDLRENSGGAPEMVQYIGSHFFDKKDKISFSSLEFRSQKKWVKFPNLKKLKGHRLPHTPLYILTSRRTGSAAESLAYDLQQLGRATLVGDTTLGAANPAKVFMLPADFRALIAIGRAVSPVTGTNWEGIGVIPDEYVEVEDAREKALILALLKSADNVEDSGEKSYLLDLASKQDVALFQKRVDTDSLKLLEGKYGEREIFFEDEKLYYINRKKATQPSRLLQLPSGQFTFETIQTPINRLPRIKFIWQEGEVKSYIITYPSGNQKTILRDG